MLQYESMDQEDKKKLDRILELAEENNAYIRRVRSTQKTSQMLKAIYWVIIVLFAVGGFYYIKPYLESVTNLYSNLNGKSGTASSLLNLPDTKQIEGLIKQFQQK